MRSSHIPLILLALLLALPAAARVGTRRSQTPARRTARSVPQDAQLPDLTIKKVYPKAINGKRLELELHLYRPGQAHSQDVAVYWLQGSRKDTLWQGKPTFSSARGGFKHTLTVDLSGKSLNQGRIQVVALECRALARCKRDLRVSKGDLRFEGSTTFESRGSITDLKLKLKNRGPADFGACRVELRVGRRVEETWQLRGLRVGRDVELKWSYGSNFRGKRFKVEIKCTDLIGGNNSRSGTLR